MIEMGWAWVYEDYAKDPELKSLQVQAKQKKRGLWQDPSPLAPWAWRKEQALKRQASKQ